MSALAHAIESNAPESVTTISTNARVDYILRFSKHAVLVVDQDESIYSQVASQFLGSLDNDHNAAFITISPKLNDIQIRCRIVEQLFAGTLFDPEQSLAVSLINLAKQEKQAIDIVIEHAQYLSLQILHELCQLTDIAKKANYPISVLMLGTPQTGILLANSKSLFNKKISILSAQTGQLLALNANVFKASRSFFEFSRFTKWVTVFIGFILLLAVTGFWLFQQDVFSLKTKLGLQSATLNAASFITNNNESTNTSAQSTDIFLSLTAPEQQNKKISAPVIDIPAEPIDIVNAIVNFEEPSSIVISSKQVNKEKRFSSFLDKQSISTDKVKLATKADSKQTIQVESKTDESKVVQPNIIIEPLTDIVEVQASVSNKILKGIDSINTEENYYTDTKTGFVIQIAGFTQLSVYQEFLADFEKINVKRYYRLLDQQAMLVITSEIYKTRLAAEQAITLLSREIKVHQPWIKSVEAINNEINAYQRSQ